MTEELHFDDTIVSVKYKLNKNAPGVKKASLSRRHQLAFINTLN